MKMKTTIATIALLLLALTVTVTVSATGPLKLEASIGQVNDQKQDATVAHDAHILPAFDDRAAPVNPAGRVKLQRAQPINWPPQPADQDQTTPSPRLPVHPPRHRPHPHPHPHIRPVGSEREQPAIHPVGPEVRPHTVPVGPEKEKAEPAIHPIGPEVEPTIHPVGPEKEPTIHPVGPEKEPTIHPIGPEVKPTPTPMPPIHPVGPEKEQQPDIHPIGPEVSQPFAVSDMCLESYPCQHEVSFADGSVRTMNGREIARMYMERSEEVPQHFRQYLSAQDLPLNIEEQNPSTNKPDEPLVLEGGITHGSESELPSMPDATVSSADMPPSSSTPSEGESVFDSIFGGLFRSLFGSDLSEELNASPMTKLDMPQGEVTTQTINLPGGGIMVVRHFTSTSSTPSPSPSNPSDADAEAEAEEERAFEASVAQTPGLEIGSSVKVITESKHESQPEATQPEISIQTQRPGPFFLPAPLAMMQNFFRPPAIMEEEENSFPTLRRQGHIKMNFDVDDADKSDDEDDEQSHSHAFGFPLLDRLRRLRSRLQSMPPMPSPFPILRRATFPFPAHMQGREEDGYMTPAFHGEGEMEGVDKDHPSLIDAEEIRNDAIDKAEAEAEWDRNISDGNMAQPTDPTMPVGGDVDNLGQAEYQPPMDSGDDGFMVPHPRRHPSWIDDHRGVVIGLVSFAVLLLAGGVLAYMRARSRKIASASSIVMTPPMHVATLVEQPTQQIKLPTPAPEPYDDAADHDDRTRGATLNPYAPVHSQEYPYASVQAQEAAQTRRAQVEMSRPLLQVQQ